MTPTDRRVLLGFLVPYVFVVIVLAVGSAAAYRLALEVVEQETIRANSARMSWSLDTLETRFAEIRGMADQLEFSPFVRRFQGVTDPYDGRNTFQVMETLRNLPDHSIWNNAVVTYFLLFNRSRHALAPGVSMSLRDFHQDVLGLTDQSPDEWFARLSSVHHYGTILPVATIMYDGRERPVLLFVRSLGYPGFSEATAVFALDRTTVEQILDRVRYAAEGWAMLVADDGTVLASRAQRLTPPDVDIDSLLAGPAADVRQVGDERLFVSHATSPQMGWSIVSGQSYSAAMASVERLRRTAAATIVVMISAGTLVSFGLAYRSSSPIRALLSLFRESDGASDGMDPYALLRAGVEELISDRNTLERAARAQRPLMRAAFADQLLSGRISTARDYREFAAQLDIKWTGMLTVSALISVAGPVPLTSLVLSGLLETKAIVRRFVHELGDAEPLVYDPDEYSIAAAFAFRSRDPQTVRARLAAQIEQLNTALPESRTWRLRVAFGEFCTDPLSLSRSFRHAAALIAGTYLQSRVVLWVDDHPRPSRLIQYPERFRNRLETAIQTADSGSAAALVDELLRDNTAAGSMGPGVVRLLRAEVVSGIVSALDSTQAGKPDVRAYVDRLVEAVGDGYGGVGDLVETVEGACSIVRSSTGSHSSILLGRIVEMLDESIADASLSLEGVADRLGMSAVYVSRFFKAQTGQTFRGYVEALRMSQAKELLLSTQLPIKEIAFAVGYGSLNTFSKAFHRHNHCTATSLRSG